MSLEEKHFERQNAMLRGEEHRRSTQLPMPSVQSSGYAFEIESVRDIEVEPVSPE